MGSFFILTYSLINSVRRRLHDLFSESTFLFESGSTSFTETLIKLSSCNSDKLVQKSLHLLNRHFSAETHLFQSAVQTQLLLTEESKKVKFTDGRTLPLSGLLYLNYIQFPLLSGFLLELNILYI